LAFNLLEFSHGERPSEIHSESWAWTFW
jgi:hypothetical protein